MKAYFSVDKTNVKINVPPNGECHILPLAIANGPNFKDITNMSSENLKLWDGFLRLFSTSSTLM